MARWSSVQRPPSRPETSVPRPFDEEVWLAGALLVPVPPGVVADPVPAPDRLMPVPVPPVFPDDGEVAGLPPELEPDPDDEAALPSAVVGLAGVPLFAEVVTGAGAAVPSGVPLVVPSVAVSPEPDAVSCAPAAPGILRAAAPMLPCGVAVAGDPWDGSATTRAALPTVVLPLSGTGDAFLAS